MIPTAADINVVAITTPSGCGAVYADVAAATGFFQSCCLMGKDGVKVGPSGFVGAATDGWKRPCDG